LLSPSYAGTGYSSEFDVKSIATEIVLGSGAALPSGIDQFVAITFSGGGILTMYREGLYVNSGQAALSLSDLSDVNNWLGTSQWQQDPGFVGTFYEVRIYEQALTACGMDSAYVRGRDLVDLTCQ
jgi:hypothetical protein